MIKKYVKKKKKKLQIQILLTYYELVSCQRQMTSTGYRLEIRALTKLKAKKFLVCTNLDYHGSVDDNGQIKR